MLHLINYFLSFFLLTMTLLIITSAQGRVPKIGSRGIYVTCAIIGATLLPKEELYAPAIALILLIPMIAYAFNASKSDFLLYLLTSLGCVCMMSSNLIQIFLALELVNFAQITLIPSKKPTIYSTEAALKYFMISAISGACLLLGIAAQYSNLLDVNLTNLTLTDPHATILILIGLFIKLGIAPFHLWQPDAYEGCSYPTLIFISLVPKLFILNVLYHITQTAHLPTEIVYGAILLSGVFGGIPALYQEKTKRFITYTMILNNLFFLLAVLINAIIYLTVTFALYLINNLLTLTILMRNNTMNLRDLSNIALPEKLLLITSLFSAIGVPPLTGFFTKAIPLLGTTNHFPLLLTVVIFSTLAAFYYLRLIAIAFFYPASQKYTQLAPKITSYPTLVPAAFTVVIINAPLWII